MVPSITFIGPHNSGKTTLAAKVVACLKRKKFQVGVLKSTKETGLMIDQPGTDTYKYREAGADAVALIAPDQIFAVMNNSNINPRDWIDDLFPGFDIVICEGFKNLPDIDKIEIFRCLDTRLDADYANVVALATTNKHMGEQPAFRMDQAEELAAFLANNYIRKKTVSPPGKTTVVINGQAIELDWNSEKIVNDTIEDLFAKLKLTGPAGLHAWSISWAIRATAGATKK